MFEFPYLVELLTPKRSDSDPVEEKMKLFAERYLRVMDSGNGVSIPDNPMGQPRYSALEAIGFSGLPIYPERCVMNFNTFHTKEELDARLKKASESGIKHLLIVRGDGGPALSRLEPELIGGQRNVATSIDLLRYVNTAYPGLFVTGAAFNQYNRIAFETERLRQKIDAGAKFVITQPVIGQDPNVAQLKDFHLPIVIEAWMSANVDLLYQSVRKQREERAEGYDPVENLKILHQSYPENCIYLSMLSFKRDWKTILQKARRRAPSGRAGVNGM